MSYGSILAGHGVELPPFFREITMNAFTLHRVLGLGDHGRRGPAGALLLIFTGLLVACGSDESAAVQGVFARLGFAQAAVIGRMSEGAPQVWVE